MNRVIRLKADTAIGMLYADRTPFGGPIGIQSDDMARRVFAKALERVHREGVSLRMGRKLLDEVRSSEPFRTIAKPHPAGWTLRDEVLHPSRSSVRPAYITAARGGSSSVTRTAFPPSSRYCIAR